MHLFKQHFHPGDHVSIFCICGQIVQLLLIVVVIVQFRVQLAESPFGVPPPFSPDAVARVGPTLDLSVGGVFPLCLWIVNQRAKADALQMTRRRQASQVGQRLLINFGVDADWPGPCDATPPLPIYYECDWIKVYQRN